ncbi:hypothetical protein [Hymenobacter daeguensis]
MADQNQDLPLVVSEILIEMHELRGDIKELQKVTVHLSHSVEKLEVEMREVKGAINSLAGSMKMMMEENRHNTEMMIDAFREQGSRTQSRLDGHEGRINKLENK